jgi:glycosyltransferase involved in cell wall biosynthesis
MAKVAVITRTKNRELLLRRAIESVLSQTEKDWQHVIVNDAGDPTAVDALAAEYSKYYGDRLKIVHREKSVGMEAASNAAIKASHSDYVVIHDDDDSWEPEFLEKTLTHLESFAATKSVKGVVSHATLVLEDLKGDKVTELSREPFNPELRVLTLDGMAAANRVPPISFLYKREVFEEIGYYDEDLLVQGDWEFNLRFLSEYDIVVLPVALANYHIREAVTGAYGNTVVEGVDKHAQARAFIQNKLLRADIKAGKFGLGYLVNFSPKLRGLEQKLEGLEENLLPLGRRYKQLAKLSPFRWFRR